MKKILLAAIILLSLNCAGCFVAEADIIITKDGRVINHNKFIGNAAVIRQIEDWKTRNERFDPTPIVEGDLQGYEYATDYPDVESFVDAEGDTVKDFSRVTGWFFDSCKLNLICSSAPANVPPEAEFMVQSVLNDAVFDVALQLPYVPDNHNADEVSADGKFLQWHLAPVLIRGGEKILTVQFRLWHADKIALTAAIELLFIAATIFFLIKARAEESPDLGKDLRFKRNVFAGLSVALMIVSACMILAPVP